MNAINSKATQMSTDFNVGAAYFPGMSSDADEPKECIDLLPDRVLSNFNACNVSPGGGTPLPHSLNNTKIRQYYEFTPDPLSADRGKAVVVITDAQSADFSMADALTYTTALKNAGIKVYYMGFAGVNESNMVQLAAAGGTTPWYKVTDTNSIIAALNSISASMIPCTVSVPLTGGNDDPTRMQVSIDNNGTFYSVAPGTPNGWTYDGGTQTLELNGQSCNDLKSYASSASDPSDVGVNIKVACKVTCTPTNEVCDYLDNNCNGLIDDGIICDCGWEICGDELDNDCDGVVDDGCPACIPTGPEVCDDGIDNNCNGLIDENCDPGGCIPFPETCGDGLDNDCDGIVDNGCPTCIPDPEVCDGVDNDCDDIVDEGCTYSGCVATGPEICGDGIDNNCNGQIDEGCPTAPECTPTGPEVCGDGIDNDCNGMIDEGCTPSCVPTGPEVCGDGIDNDCNGSIDEGCPGSGGCIPKPETCWDKIDNDCDGDVDEGCPTCIPSPEICGDNIDNDCDGKIDEGCDPTCVPEPESCDGVDNDCDGDIDEGCDICVPEPEICEDGIDNDCDGEIDEGCPPPPGCIPDPEICDEKDNNCNGQIDEGCTLDS